MSDRTKIEWTDASWTPIRARNVATGNVGWHCEPASPGCENCYAENMNGRLGTRLPFKPGHRGDVEIFLDEKLLLQPLRWKRPRMIFACSMTDLFGAFVPDEMIDRIFAVMALSPQHTFQVLTKRSARMRAYTSSASTPIRILDRMFDISDLAACQAARAGQKEPWKSRPQKVAFMDDPDAGWPLKNCWIGVSAEDQKRADDRIPDLLAMPAAVRFVSAEPLLGPIDFEAVKYSAAPGFFGSALRWHHRGYCHERDGLRYPSLDWVIVGGESGVGARPMHPDWARSLRDQCNAAGVAFFFKQWGEWAPQIGAVDGWTIGDDPEQSRFDHREWDEDDQCWGDVFRPIWCDFEDGNYEEEHTVSRLGKKRSGRLLDGREWNDMPALAGTAVAA